TRLYVCEKLPEAATEPGTDVERGNSPSGGGEPPEQLADAESRQRRSQPAEPGVAAERLMRRT
ncbi:MAG TPA: hypothetical protein V6D08_12750, partial [Candidatus Obscuribacterales bacterium]